MNPNAAPKRGRSKSAVTYVVAAVSLLLLLFILGTIIPRPLFVGAAGNTGAEGRSVLLLYNPIHTDIAFPADPDVLEKLGFVGDTWLPLDHPQVQWIVLGWGGRSFYLETPTWADLKPLPVFKALTIDRSVMHVSLAGDIDPDVPGVDELSLSQSGFDKILDRLVASFKTNTAGSTQPIEGAGYGEFDRFFEAHGRFNAVVGCNTWTASVLREAGVRTGFWNPLPVSLRWSLRLFGTCPWSGGECRT